MSPKIILYILFGCGICQTLTAQNAPQFSNMGAQVSIRSGAFLSIQGDARNDRNGSIENFGVIHAFGDWANFSANKVFTRVDTGVVRMRGDSQTISGTFPTRFYDLVLENTGVKFATVDVDVHGYLRLNDREFDLDTNTCRVFSYNLAAISTGLAGTWGFVSALQNGGLARNTNTSQAYFYPVGSSRTPNRFRPVYLTPTGSMPNNEYKIRFANVDATAEGFDRSARALEVCEVNPAYYHRISQVNPEPANLQFLYATADGTFSNLGKWGGVLWEESKSLTQGFDNTYQLATLSTNAPVPAFSPNPFAFIQSAASVSLAAAATTFCANEPLNLTASGNFSNFDFYVDTFLRQSSPTATYASLLPAKPDYKAWVVGTNTNPTCGRRSDTLTLLVHPALQGAISNDTIIVVGTSANLLATATGGLFYDWTPTDFLSCTNCPNPSANPTQTTTYTGTVENANGCTFVDTVQVTVRTSVAWYIQNIALFPKNKVRIINRWGDSVFQSEYYNNDWDGRYSGGLLPAGTYYYILDLGDGWGVFKGDVTIIR
jgi:gliding motility-associated-like protein